MEMKFHLPCKRDSFPHERLCTRPRFYTKAWGNSEMPSQWLAMTVTQDSIELENLHDRII